MVSIMFTGAASGLLFSRWLLPRKPNGAGAAG
jgi:hypothetical protein